MHAVNVRALKNNPSEALRSAQDDVVVVLNRDRPQALLVDLKRSGISETKNVRVVLAVSLFKQGDISLGYAARVADKSVAEMMDILIELGIPIVTVTAEDLERDAATLAAWHK